MFSLQVGLTLAALFVCAFVPGFFLVRRCRWSPLEKLCGGIGFSLIVLYLYSWCFCSFAPRSFGEPRWTFRLAALFCLGLGIFIRHDIFRLARSFPVRRVLAGYFFLLFWTFVVLAMIRNYSGAGWFGDWLEHFQRSLFFLHRFPAHTAIFPGYILPARPPMMSVLAAFFLAQTQDRFEIFQIVFVFLNLLTFLSCCLIVPALGGLKRRILPLVGLFAMAPVVMQSATYTWTKALSAFYVVLALWFYLAGWRKRDSGRMVACFLFLSAGVLIHYGAGPFCLFLALHYLLLVFRKRERRWRELALIVGSSALLLATWFGWSFAVYGWQETLASNTAVTTGQQYAGHNLEKIFGNMGDSLAPRVLYSPLVRSYLEQPFLPGTIRDIAFLVYQANFLFSMGVAGGPLVVWLVWRGLRRRENARRERLFWLLLIPFCFAAGIAVVGERDPTGVAHLTLLPLEVLGLTLLAANFSWRRAVAFVILAGCIVDFSLGIFLHARIENLENSPERTVFPGLTVAGTVLAIGLPGPDSLSRTAWSNWFFKHHDALCRQWLQELSEYRLSAAALQSARAPLEHELQQDDALWYGWYARNDGTLTFLGDHFTGPSWHGADAQTLLLLALFLGLVWRMGMQAVGIAPARVSPKRSGPAADRSR